MTATDGRSSRWWQSRRLRLFLLVGILAVLVARTGLDLWAGHRVDTEIARLESQYGSLELSAGVPPEVPDADNRARLVRAAAALVTSGAGTGSGSVVGSVRRFKALTEPSPVPEDLRAFVDANREALRLVDQARVPRQAYWGTDYDTAEDMPPLAEMRTLSHAIYLAALLDIEVGRIDEAATTLASGLAVAASVSQEPPLITQLIRIAVALDQFDGIEQLIARSEPSNAALEDLAHWLRESREPDPLYAGLLGELRYGNAMMTRLEDGHVSRVPRFPDTPFYVQARMRIGRPFARLSRARYLQRMGALLEAQAGPRPRAPIAPESPRSWMGRRWTQFTTGFERAMETGDLFVSALGATELGVALRRYRLDHAAYPDTLSAVVPAYLPSLPLDPFTGRPPVYQRLGAGFTMTAEGGRVDRPAHPALEWTVLR
jgi:hypothetical protein